MLVEGLDANAVIEWVGQAIQCVLSGHGEGKVTAFLVLPKMDRCRHGDALPSCIAAEDVGRHAPEAMAPVAQIHPIGPGPSLDAPVVASDLESIMAGDEVVGGFLQLLAHGGWRVCADLVACVEVLPLDHMLRRN